LTGLWNTPHPLPASGPPPPEFTVLGEVFGHFVFSPKNSAGNISEKFLKANCFFGSGRMI